MNEPAGMSGKDAVPGLFTIEPIQVGARIADSSLFLHLTDPGVKIEIAYRVWILRNAEQTIVVDTGPPLEEGRRRHLDSVSDVSDRLRSRGVDPAHVELVVLTHLHWDHAANAGIFPNARFLAQRSEIEFFRSAVRTRPVVDRFFSHQAELGRLIDTGRIVPIDGDQALSDGLRAIRVGGHTPGSQMLIVETPSGRCIITGDAVPLNRNYVDRIPSGILVDLREAIAALDRVDELDPVAIYTGHDMEPVLWLKQT